MKLGEVLIMRNIRPEEVVVAHDQMTVKGIVVRVLSLEKQSNGCLTVLGRVLKIEEGPKPLP
jgi:hypothetical protein